MKHYLTMAAKLKTVMLRDMPQDVDRLIEKEQMRLGLYEDQKLKKGAIVVRIIRDWYRLKNIENELINKLNQTNASV